MSSKLLRRVLIPLLLPLSALTGCSGADDLGAETDIATLEQGIEICAAGALPITSASASSAESAALGAGNAIDGNASTRWSSAFSDPQWLQVDLGTLRQIGRVLLSWETA